MNEGIMTRRKSRTLTSDWQEPNAKRPKTKQSETQEDRKLMTGSEPMTRQRKKALETAAATDCSSVASRQSSDPAVSSEVIASSEKNESARKQRQRAAVRSDEYQLILCCTGDCDADGGNNRGRQRRPTRCQRERNLKR
jgi:hypothetical protein